MSFDSGRRPRSYLRSQSGQRIELVPNRIYVLGRGECCDLRIDDPGSSRRHAKISVAGDAQVVYLEDLQSKNGTYRNEERVQGSILLEDGDAIRVGATVYEVKIWKGGMDLELDTRTTMLK